MLEARSDPTETVKAEQNKALKQGPIVCSKIDDTKHHLQNLTHALGQLSCLVQRSLSLMLQSQTIDSSSCCVAFRTSFSLEWYSGLVASHFDAAAVANLNTATIDLQVGIRQWSLYWRGNPQPQQMPPLVEVLQNTTPSQHYTYSDHSVVLTVQVMT